MPQRGQLVYRQTGATRLTHAIWATCLFFLVLSGLQIFNAFPRLQIGRESGFDYDNTVFEILAVETAAGLRGETRLGPWRIDTTGLFGVQGDRVQAVPAALTIPSSRNLAFGRVVHFFFAWVLVATLAVWAVAALWSGHLRRDLIPGRADLAALPGDLIAHLRLRFHHGPRYNVLQKLAYGGVLFGLFPLVIVTGLAMSPGVNALFPWLADALGGRQTARTLHFLCMLGFVAFFLVHMAMILAAGPLNELRSIITGWYRTDPEDPT